ncbi:hypothetical protein [Aminobacter aganoensis]
MLIDIGGRKDGYPSDMTASACSATSRKASTRCMACSNARCRRR